MENIKIYDENRFNKIIKNNIVTELIFNIINPYLLYIKLDYIANELVIEFSGKYLVPDFLILYVQYLYQLSRNVHCICI